MLSASTTQRATPLFCRYAARMFRLRQRHCHSLFGVDGSQFLDGESEEPVAKLSISVPHKGAQKSKLAVSPSVVAMVVGLVAFVGAKSVKNAAEGGH